MRRKFLDIENRQAETGHDRHHSEEREVGKVLVINSVELIPLHQAHQMGKFEGNESVALEYGFHALHKAAQIWDVGQDVVSYH